MYYDHKKQTNTPLIDANAVLFLTPQSVWNQFYRQKDITKQLYTLALNVIIIICSLITSSIQYFVYIVTRLKHTLTIPMLMKELQTATSTQL